MIRFKTFNSSKEDVASSPEQTTIRTCIKGLQLVFILTLADKNAQRNGKGKVWRRRRGKEKEILWEVRLHNRTCHKRQQNESYIVSIDENWGAGEYTWRVFWCTAKVV